MGGCGCVVGGVGGVWGGGLGGVCGCVCVCVGEGGGAHRHAHTPSFIDPANKNTFGVQSFTATIQTWAALTGCISPWRDKGSS